MAEFSFNLHYGGHKYWVCGELTKNADGHYVATSEMFPGHSATEQYMTHAAHAFQDGLVAWLVEHIEQAPKRESISAGIGVDE